MYMGPIVRARPSVSPFTRRLVGGGMVLGAVTVMVPFLALQAGYAAAVLGARSLLATIDHAGIVAFGR